MVADAEYGKLEKGRTEWFSHHLSLSEYKKAAKYAVTDEEKAEITACQEKDRLAWYKYSIDTGKYARALEYAVSAEEEAGVAKAQLDAQETGRIEWMQYFASTAQCVAPSPP